MTSVPVLAGPTASGKTALSLDLAQHYPLEIISADAMMVYRGMDIGTAKPSLTERHSVPHHLIDLLEPNTDFSVASWVNLAESAIAGILARGRIPLVVGGTGFYIRALSEGLPTTPASDQAAMRALEAELQVRGLEALLEELQQASPEDAIRTQRNPRRVLRALEILRGTGKPPKNFPPLPPRYQYSKVVLLPNQAELERRIAARTRQMLKVGLLEETARLAPLFGHNGRRPTSLQAIGYRQALETLAGGISLEETEKRINLATRQYAKRQATWLKKEPEASIVHSLEAARTALVRLIEAYR